MAASPADPRTQPADDGRAASRLICAGCGAKADHPGICWDCFDKEAMSPVHRDARERANG